MRHKTIWILHAILLGCIVSAAEEKHLRIEDVPEAVRATIHTHADGGTIIEIEKEQSGDTPVYEVEIKKGRGRVEFQVSETGEYLGPETDDDKDGDRDGEDGDENESAVEWSQLPDAVKNGLNTVLNGATAERVTREMEDGRTVYEAEFSADGQTRAVTVSDQGVVLETESEIAADALPEAVAAQLPDNAEIREAELKTVTFYEIELRVNGKDRELRIRPDGAEVDNDD